jgi:hypothetical protein
MSKYVVRIDHDSDTESPASYDCNWRMYSFSNRHVNFREPSDFFDDNGKPLLWLRNKLRVGLAHILSYYEHGQCAWMLANGTHPAGVEFQWDGVRVAGVAVWEDSPSDIGGKTFQERAEDCARFLECYTDWCNGNCYCYSIEKMGKCEACGHEEPDEDIDSCGGFIGEESVCEAIQDAMPDDATEENTDIEGEAAWIAEYHDIFPKTAKV